MKVDTAKKIIILVIALLIFREFASFLAAVVGVVPALIGAILVLAVQLFLSRLKGKGFRHYAYVLIPTLIFTVIPIAMSVRKFLGISDRSFFGAMWDFIPLTVGFVLPVLLLLIVWWILNSQRPSVPAVQPEPSKDVAPQQS